MAADRVLALVLLAGAAVYLGILVPEVGRAQTALGTGDFYTVGPTALPTFAGAMVAIFSIAVLAQGRRTVPAASFGEGLFGGAVFALLVAVTAILMPRIGFLPAATGFLVAVFLVYRATRWWIALILVLALPILIDQVLRKVFLIPLPQAPFF
ncbi:tripartite tricarboxylate transporter TctB family protein [Amorphus coralli]|uniref:tripartite tricarboxylate transporter TctB family protein n=1 Tax=Amorphus coralli TaxID=340680 RepID=UPI00036E7153|nr:tripartite tricarboxylate transporter TctB family protein [Amorphus coralli]